MLPAPPRPDDCYVSKKCGRSVVRYLRAVKASRRLTRRPREVERSLCDDSIVCAIAFNVSISMAFATFQISIHKTDDSTIFTAHIIQALQWMWAEAKRRWGDGGVDMKNGEQFDSTALLLRKGRCLASMVRRHLPCPSFFPNQYRSILAWPRVRWNAPKAFPETESNTGARTALPEADT